VKSGRFAWSTLSNSELSKIPPQGGVTIPEFATQILPRPSLAMPIGRLIPASLAFMPVSEWIRLPSVSKATTLLLPLPGTHALPSTSIAMSNGNIIRELSMSSSGCKANARSGLPLGNCVTLSSLQFAIQMFPSLSETMPCGCLIVLPAP